MRVTPQGGEGWTPEAAGRDEQGLLKEIARLERVAERSAPVLVADDMQTMRLILGQALRQAGFARVERAADGEAALKTLKERGCDLALVDWNMPRMDGLELLGRVRSDPELEDLVFIMVTAETLDIKVIRAAEERQDAYLTKPISPEKLARRLELILERRLTTARALLLECRGETDRAVEAFLAASQNRPRARWPLFGLGGLLARLGRFEEAERCYQRVLELDPSASAALLEMGRIRQGQGRYEEARELFQQALADSPRFFKAYDALARAMLAEGDAAGALQVLSRAMAQQGTENAARQELLGRLHLELGHYPEAESAFRKALELKPGRNRLENNLRLGQALLAQGRYQEAAETLARAEGPGRGRERLQAMLLEGMAHARNRDIPRAERAFSRILDPEAWEGRPPWGKARYHREVGGAYLESGCEDQAVRHFCACLLLEEGGDGGGGGDEGGRWEEIARLCRRAGRPELMERVGQELEAARERRVEDCARRGLELVAQGRLQEALAEYHRGLELDPGAGRLHFNLARLQQRLGRGQDSLAAMVTAARLGLERGDWELVVEAARFFAGEGRGQEALGLLERVPSSAPAYAPAQELRRHLEASSPPASFSSLGEGAPEPPA